MPRVNDGALLFLQTMLAKMKAPEKGGSRIAIIFNGRRFPMATAVRAKAKSGAGFWRTTGSTRSSCCPTNFSTTRASSPTSGCCEMKSLTSHRGRVMIIDARKQFEKEPKSFGNKRNRMTDAHRKWIEERYRDGWEDGYTDTSSRCSSTRGFCLSQSERGLLADRRERPAGDRHGNIHEGIHRRERRKGAKLSTAANQFFSRRSKLDEPVIRFKAKLTVPDSDRTAEDRTHPRCGCQLPETVCEGSSRCFAPEIDLLLKKLTKAATRRKR